MFKTRKTNFVDVSSLKRLGGGVTGTVYQLSKNYVIKVYCNAHDWYCRKDGDLIAMTQELEAGLESDFVLPIEDVVVAKKGRKLYHASIKRYLPHKCSWEEACAVQRKLPRHLNWDIHEANVRKDSNGKAWLIDSHGPYYDC